MQLPLGWLGSALSLLALTCGGTEGLPTKHDSKPFILDDWELVAASNLALSSVCTTEPDSAVTITGKPTGYLQSKHVYTNYRATFEWRWSGAPGNSGLLVHIGSGPIDRNTWPLCVQIQLKHGNAGDVLPMAGASCAEVSVVAGSTRPPQMNHLASDSEAVVGEWNRCELVAKAGTIDFVLNGVVQSHVTHCVPSSGRIGFQLEGAPFQLRNISIEESP
ncbi:MAG: DUF1080 domain-containing protein [Opitutus sp.]